VPEAQELVATGEPQASPDREQAVDLLVLGGGPGGYAAAIRAAQLGLSVVLVEKDRLGGVCLNRGCIPTKAMARSAHLWRLLNRAAEFGVAADNVRLDFARVMARQREVTATLVGGLGQLMVANRVRVVRGEGQVRVDGTVEVAGEGLFRPRRLILATGSLASRLPIPGMELPGVVDSDGILQAQSLPARLVVIGGGIVGCEFASIFAAFGSRVTVLELLPGLLPMADAELGRRLAQSLRRAGVEVRTGVRVEAVQAVAGAAEDGPWGPPKRVLYRDGTGAAGSAEGEAVLVAVGRRPAFSGFDPDGLGIQAVQGGLRVDGFLQTTRPGVYAVGDVNGLSLLAHAASAQGLIAAEHAAGRTPRPWGTSPVPACVFTLPEVAWVGMTEEEARQQGVPYGVGRFSYTALGRAHVDGETEGFVKILYRAQPPGAGEVLGVHLLGHAATELVHEGVLALRFGASVQELAEAIHAHPTFSEAVAEAAHAALGLPVHMARR